MAYAVIADVKKILKIDFFDYPVDMDIGAETEWAEARINSKLGGIYTLRFDNTSFYPTVPVEIKWITALLIAYRLWDAQTVLEGQSDDTQADGWRKEAMEWLKCVAGGECRLMLDDGALVALPTTISMRSYPNGVRTKEPSEDNDPLFTRAQVGAW